MINTSTNLMKKIEIRTAICVEKGHDVQGEMFSEQHDDPKAVGVTGMERLACCASGVLDGFFAHW